MIQNNENENENNKVILMDACLEKEHVEIAKEIFNFDLYDAALFIGESTNGKKNELIVYDNKNDLYNTFL